MNQFLFLGKTITKSAIGMEEIVAIQMRQWTIVLNVLVLITRKANRIRLKIKKPGGLTNEFVNMIFIINLQFTS